MTLAQTKTLMIGVLKQWFPNKETLDKISEDTLESVKTSAQINGIPSGGLAGQLLIKASDDDYDCTWAYMPMYEGPYNVTPRVYTQTLPTCGMLMGNNVEIESIPYVEVSNTQGGTTVTIG